MRCRARRQTCTPADASCWLRLDIFRETEHLRCQEARRTPHGSPATIKLGDHQQARTRLVCALPSDRVDRRGHGRRGLRQASRRVSHGGSVRQLPSRLLIQASGTMAAYRSAVRPRDMTSRKYLGAFIDHTRSVTVSPSRLSVSTDAPTPLGRSVRQRCQPRAPDGCTFPWGRFSQLRAGTRR